MTDLGVWTVDGDAPRRVDRSVVDLEKDLEGWIANDSSLLAAGLTVVGRQVWLDGGPLDLLAIDKQDRWVVIELKRTRLHRRALAQALDYASSIAQMDDGDLEDRLRGGLAALGDADELSRVVRRQLEGEGGPREVAVLLAGVGVDAGLERIVEHLGDTYGVPIRIVSFEVFEPDGGPRVLIREVTEEQAESRPPQPRRTVEMIRQRAVEAGVVTQFNRFVNMSEEHEGLAVQAQKHSVRIAPRANRTRYLMYARPEAGDIVLSASPEAFAEFFPPLTPDRVRQGIGLPDEGQRLGGAELDAALDQIESFLETLPRPDEDDSE